MTATQRDTKKQIKALEGKVKMLRTEFREAERREGKDPYISVVVKKKQGRFERVRKKESADVALGHFFFMIDVVTKEKDIFVPLSIASGKKPAGFFVPN